jgi:hypothetical protein
MLTTRTLPQLLSITCVLVLASACDTTGRALGPMQPQPRELHIIPRDPAFHLIRQDRQRLRPGFDADALETLLAHIPAASRDEIVSYFMKPESPEIKELWYIGDPALQEFLEAVWAPMWDHVPEAQIAADTTQRPGKRLALQRRRLVHQ